MFGIIRKTSAAISTAAAIQIQLIVSPLYSSVLFTHSAVTVHSTDELTALVL